MNRQPIVDIHNRRLGLSIREIPDSARKQRTPF